MAGKTLTTASVLVCPHQGQIQVSPSQTRVRVDGQPALTTSDVMTISGCPFHVGTSPSPCVSIQWVQPDLRTRAGVATLSETSVGLCLNPSGAPQGQVIVQQTQIKVNSE